MRSVSVLASVAFFAVFGAACKSENQLTEEQFHEPVLELSDPAPSAWKSAGPISATGKAEYLSDVTIGGAPADVTGGAMSANVELRRGINIVEASGKDEHGDTRFVRSGVIAGEFADPGQSVMGAAQLRVNQGGLDTALEQAALMLDPATLNSSLSAANPVYEDSYGVWGWDAVNVRADVVDVYFGSPSLRANPDNGYLALTADIPDLIVQVYVSGDVVGLDFGVDVWVGASVAEILGDLTVDAKNGKLTVDLPSSSVELYDFWYDTSLLPGDIEQYILVDTIRALLEEKIEAQIDEQVPPLLEEQLAGLDLSMETELLGKTVSVAADIAAAGVDEDGIVLDVDLDVDIPSDGDKTYAGYLAAPAAIPDPSRDSDVAVAIGDDLLNRVLFEAWRANVLDMTLSTDDGSLEPYMLLPLKASQGTISISAGLPPVIVENDGNLQAQMGELEVTIDTPDGELGQHLVASIGLFIDLEVSVDDNKLKLSLGEPDVVITVRDSDWGASNESTTRLLQEMLPIDLLVGLIGDLSFDLPSLAGVSIRHADAEREDNGSFTDLDVSLGR